MSVKVMGLVWDYYPEGGGELLTALKVADHADHNGDRIWPSVADLALHTRQSERSVQRSLRAMQDNGWLELVRESSGKPGDTRRYRIPVERIPGGVSTRVTDCHPSTGDTGGATGDAGATPTGDKHDKTGDTAMSPKPSLKQPSKETVISSGGALPTPVAQAFKAYSEGIKRKYSADYPPSAKANGQLANVVGRIGGDNVVAVVGFYLGHQAKFYGQVKHSLDYLVRDCEKLWLELQAASGSATPAPPTHARVALLAADGKVMRELDQQPAGDMEAIAKKAAAAYAGLIARLSPKYVAVRQGSDRRQFDVTELR